jgi:hypothetical protein
LDREEKEEVVVGGVATLERRLAAAVQVLRRRRTRAGTALREVERALEEAGVRDVSPPCLFPNRAASAGISLFSASVL